MIKAIVNNRRVKQVGFQVAVAAIVVGLVGYLAMNTIHNLHSRNIATGFAFITREAGFGISESLISYSPVDQYARALLVGLVNTVKVTLLGVLLATVLGTIAGIARLSKNRFIASLSTLYIESLRNVPLLLQLFFWYSLLTELLPGPRSALMPLPGIYLSSRGMRLPELIWERAHLIVLLALAGAVAAVFVVSIWARRRRLNTGKSFPSWQVCILILLCCPGLAWWLSGASLALDVPRLQGFNFVGGLVVTPEFAALLVGLVLYTGTFIAEIVRGGIMSVSHGQTDAGIALGMSQWQLLRLVIFPQALRVVIPPLTSQYLNLAKNSSLAVAIGYPDLVSVANTAINQTGQAVEGISIIMGVYLVISLSIATFMNWYNRHIHLIKT